MHIWDDTLGYKTFPYKRYAYKPDPNGDFESIYGDRLKKVSKFRRDEPDLFESDVPEVTRVLVDTYTDSDLPSNGHVILTFDIEVEMESGTPDPMKANNEITSIAVHDSVTDEYVIYILDKERQLERRKKQNVEIIPFSNEKDLLISFVNKFEEISPTIITGWNIDYFDVPYVLNRIKLLIGENVARRMSPIREVFYSPYRKRWFIGGVSALDYLTLYKAYNYSELDNYRLDTVANIELGRGKVSYSGNLDELFKNDIERFIEYNLEDVRLIVDLDRKLQFIDLCRGIAHAGRVAYEDVFYASRIMEGALLAFLKQQNLVAPNKMKQEESDAKIDEMKAIQGDDEYSKESKFIGAYVKDPVLGLHEWIYDLDLTSLYPSIIMSLNISPETKLGKVDNWDAVEYSKSVNTVYDVMGMQVDSDKMKSFLESKGHAISSNGVIYRQDKRGCIPAILELWFIKRSEYKKKMQKFGNEGNEAKYLFFKKRQLVQKILLNSLYGVLGLPSFRFYDLDNAEAVTTTGRTVILSTSSMANLKYQIEMGSNYKTITLDNSKEYTTYPKTKISIERDGNSIVEVGENLKVGDLIGNTKIVSIQDGNFQKDDYGVSNHTIYIDTDSIFVSAVPLLNHRNINWREQSQEDIALQVGEIAEEMQDYLNKFYNILSKKFFNIDPDCHRFEIKKEFVAKSGIWLAKKRYAQWIILDNGVPVDRLDIKGLDVIRSTFPKAFANFMRQTIIDILRGAQKAELDTKIIDFKTSLSTIETYNIAKSTGVKELSKYTPEKGTLFQFKKGTPAHVKAAWTYNQLLKYFNCGFKYSSFRNGDKIKWVYLKQNPLKLEKVAFKGDNDPDEIMNFIKNYIDYDTIFEQEMHKKLQLFYEALGWGNLNTKLSKSDTFFSF